MWCNRVGSVGRIAPLLILPKRWFFYSFIYRFIVALTFFSMTDTGSQLYAGRDFNH